MRTYESLYQNEVRSIDITLNNEDGTALIPSAAYIMVEDSEGDEVISEISATINSNNISATISTTVTTTIGEYRAIWKVRKDSYTHYHSTIINVSNL